MPSCRGMRASRVCSLPGGIKNNSEYLTAFWKKKSCQEGLWPRNSYRFMAPGAWTPSVTPELQFCKRFALRLVPAAPGGTEGLMQFAAGVCRPQKTQMIICRFAESLLDFSLSLFHKETLRGTQRNRIWTAVRSPWCSSSGVVGASPVWRGWGLAQVVSGPGLVTACLGQEYSKPLH